MEVEYTAESFEAAHCTLYDGNVFTGGLLTNGEHLHENLERTGFHMWLFEGTDTMEVRVSYGGEGALELSGVRFTETDKLWTMLLTVVLFGFGAVLLLLHYHYNLRHRLTKEQKTVIWGLFLITLFASYFPLSGKGLHGIDLSYHYMRIEGVKDGFLSGQLPMRIEPEWLYGQGFACGIFYCNFFLMIPAFFRLMGFTVVMSCNIYFMVLNFATAYFSYLCFRKIYDNMQIGLVCSGLYTLSVFRMYKLYNTGDLGEGVAYTFLPLIVYGYYRVFTEDTKEKAYKTAWIPLALGYAGVMQTHILSCIILGFLTIVVCLICIRKIFHLPTFVQLAKAALAALALAAWFFVPFLDYYLTQDVHIKNLTARTIQNKGLLPAQHLFHFWRNGSSISQGYNGMQYSYPVSVGMVLMVGLAVFLIIWFNGFQRLQKGEEKVTFVKRAGLLAILLLAMSLNAFPWDRLQGLSEVTAPFISSLEFPARVLGPTMALLVVCFGFCMWYFYETGRQKCYWGSVLVALIGITTATFFMCDHINANMPAIQVYNEEGMGFGFVSDEEYVIEGTPVSQLRFELPVHPENVILAEYEKNYLKVNMACENLTGGESYIDLPILNYRDYHAFTSDGGELEIVNNEKMQIRVLLPEGFLGRVEVKFVSPIYWRISEIVSLCMILTFAALGIRTYRERRRNREEMAV